MLVDLIPTNSVTNVDCSVAKKHIHAEKDKGSGGLQRQEPEDQTMQSYILCKKKNTIYYSTHKHCVKNIDTPKYQAKTKISLQSNLYKKIK